VTGDGVPDDDGICRRSFEGSFGDGPTPQMAATSMSARGVIVRLRFRAGGGPVGFVIGHFCPRPIIDVLLTEVVELVRGAPGHAG
jgi:hypothetical protein